MTVRRIVANLQRTPDAGSREFFTAVLGLDPVMDRGWITTLAAPGRPAVQISLLTHDKTAPVIPSLSIEVDDVDAIHDACVDREMDIVHPLTDEPWGVRRFFVREPGGTVVNVLEHQRRNDS